LSFKKNIGTLAQHINFRGGGGGGKKKTLFLIVC